ncbi:MAG: hypothetical protein ACT4OK_19330 [Gemmobacter sp.]
MKPQAAVLTGDLVGSSEATSEAVDAAMARIRKIGDQIGPKVATFARFRGDGWQLYLERPGLGLATTLLVFADLRSAGGLESRISLGVGGAYFNNLLDVFAVRDVFAATGSAFIASGQALDKMGKSRRLALSGDGIDLLHSRLMAMIEERVVGWSHEQAEVAALALAPNPMTQAEMAAHLGITRQAVSARLRAAGFKQLNSAAIDFRELFGSQGEPSA